MDSRMDAAGRCEPGAAASQAVAATGEALRWHAEQLREIRRRALSVAVLSWESPAGGAFRAYLDERCTELTRTIDLLETTMGDLDLYEHLLREAELRQQAGP